MTEKPRTDCPSPSLVPSSAAAAIRRLHAELLSLATTEGELPMVELKKTADSIIFTIRAAEQAEAFLASQPGHTVPGNALSQAEIDRLLAAMQRMVDNGVLEARR